LEECKNCHNCYLLESSENDRHMYRGMNIKDSIYGVGSIIEKSVYSTVDYKNYDTVATLHCDSCRYSMYMDYCEECEYCFGCIGLRKKKFCILNKQYSEADYHALVAKIKEEMTRADGGLRFFPYDMAYGGYNFSTANIYFPAARAEVETWGGLWEEPREGAVEGVPGDATPDNINDVPANMPEQAIICPTSGWRFNIAPGELAFYKERGIPLPRCHFDVRVLELFKPLTILTTFNGTCCFCKKEIQHNYPPEVGYQKIACEECYAREVS